MRWPGLVGLFAVLAPVLAGCAGLGGPSSLLSAPCVAPAASGDREIAAAAAGVPGLCVRSVALADAGLTIPLALVESGRPGPLFVVPHDDENAALVAGIAALQRHGGRLVAVRSGGTRDIGRGRAAVDPNRIFGNRRTGPVCPGGRRPAVAYTEAVLSARVPGQPILGLHSNKPGPPLSARPAPRGMTAVFPPVPPPAGDRFADPDTFLIVPVRDDPADQARVEPKVARFGAAGATVLLEMITPPGDCSLSSFLVLSGQPDYVTVEVRDGDSRTSGRLIDLVLARPGGAV